MNSQKKIVEIKNLTVRSSKDNLVLIDSLSLDLYEGEIISVLGVSGSGKTTLALTLMGLLAKNLHQSGSIYFDQNKKWIRGKDKAMIFQDPQVALNPYLKVGFQLFEVIKTHLKDFKDKGIPFLVSRLKEVGFSNSNSILDAYPHQLSGGEKQRVLIAMTLLCNPSLLIADEPTSSLDFVLKVQILKLLLELKKKRKFTLLLITHDPLIASRISDRIFEMKQGTLLQKVEHDEHELWNRKN